MAPIPMSWVCRWSKQHAFSSGLGSSPVPLADLRHFPRDRRFGVRPFTAQNTVEEPDDETIHRQDDDGANASLYEKMVNLERNQCRRREAHEKLGPAFLQINANTLGEKDARINERGGRG